MFLLIQKKICLAVKNIYFTNITKRLPEARGQMESQPNQQPQKLCKKCKKMIRIQNYTIHEVRCRGPTSSRINPDQNEWEIFSNSSRIFSNNISNRNLNQQEKIPCHFCGYSMSLAELDTHPANCQHRQLVCGDCRCPFPKSLMEEHKIVCIDSRRIQDYMDYESDVAQQYERQVQPPRYERHQSVQNQFIQPFNNIINSFSVFSSQPQNRNNPNPFFQGQRQVRERSGRRERQHQRQIFNVMFGSRNRRRQRLAQENGHQEFIHPFQQLIRLLASRRNVNSNPGLTKQETESIQKIKYHQKEGSEKDLCTICYCEFEQDEQINKLKCNHLYHHECIGKWLQTNASCPVCKRSMVPENRQRQPIQRQPQHQQHYIVHRFFS